MLPRMDRISPGMRSSYSSSVFTRRQVSCALCLVSRSSMELGLNSSPALILSVSFMLFPPLWRISGDVTGYILIIIYHAAPLLSSVFCRFRKKSWHPARQFVLLGRIIIGVKGSEAMPPDFKAFYLRHCRAIYRVCFAFLKNASPVQGEL